MLEALDRNEIIKCLCRVIYEIEIEESSLWLLRKKFPNVVEVKRKVNILNMSTSAKKTTRAIL